MVVSDIQCFAQAQYTGPPSTVSEIVGTVTASTIYAGNVVATDAVRTATTLYAGNIVFNSVLASAADDAGASSADVPVGGVYANVGVLQIRRA